MPRINVHPTELEVQVGIAIGIGVFFLISDAVLMDEQSRKVFFCSSLISMIGPRSFLCS